MGEILTKAYIRCKPSYQNSINDITDYITFLRAVYIIHENRDFSYGKQITVVCLSEDLYVKFNENKYLKFLEDNIQLLTNNGVNYL